MTGTHQPLHHTGTHPAQSNHSQLHNKTPLLFLKGEGNRLPAAIENKD
jgi:hypothetical protein